MTREILDSDVDVLERLAKEGSSDNQIITALGRRGIEAVRATKLVNDWRNGSRVRPKMILLPRRVGQRNRPV